MPTDALRHALALQAWGPFNAPADLDAIVPTLTYWLPLLADGPTLLYGARRPPFQPPQLAIWRGMHAALPLLRPVLPAALVQLPGLADVVLGGLVSLAHSLAAEGQQQQPSAADRAAVQWYAAGCAAELCRGLRQALLAHTAVEPGTMVGSLVAMLEGDSR